MDVRVLPCIYMAISQATASRSKADCRRCALSLLGPRIASHRLSDQSNFLKQTKNWNASFDVAQLFFWRMLEFRRGLFYSAATRSDRTNSEVHVEPAGLFTDPSLRSARTLLTVNLADLLVK